MSPPPRCWVFAISLIAWITIYSIIHVTHQVSKAQQDQSALPLPAFNYSIYDANGFTAEYLPHLQSLQSNGRYARHVQPGNDNEPKTTSVWINGSDHPSVEVTTSMENSTVTSTVPTSDFSKVTLAAIQNTSIVTNPATVPDLPSAQRFRELRKLPKFPSRTLIIHSTEPSAKMSTASRLSGLLRLMIISYIHLSMSSTSVPSTTLTFLSILETSKATYLTVFDSAGRFTNKELELQSISLLGVDDCSSVGNSYKKPTKHPVQVLYQPSEKSLWVLQCHLQVTTRIYPCFSDIFRSDTYPPITVHPPHTRQVSETDCHTIYETKQFAFKVSDHIVMIDDFSRHSKTKTITLSGERLTNGGCSGNSITIDSQKFKNAILETEISYYVKRIKARYVPSTNLVYVANTINYPLDQPSCDASLGCFYIEDSSQVPKDSCEMTQQIMVGVGKLFVPNTEPLTTQALGYVEIMQIMSENDATQGVTLTLESSKYLCGRMVRLTSIPHVYLNILQNPGTDQISHRLITDDKIDQEEQKYLDLLSSSSSLYLSGSLDIAQQFDQISNKICSLRRGALLGLLRDMMISSPHMLLNYFEGLLFLRRASTMTIYVGNPLEAQLRMTEECFDEIPVTIRVNDTEIPMFATSKARILIDNATEIPCTPPGPMHYIMSESDERLKLNRTLENIFISLAFGEFHNQLSLGGWICQSPGTFVSCSGPARLSPLIKEDENFFHGLDNKFIHKNLFGDGKREALFKSQSIGYERQAVLTQMTNSARGGHQNMIRVALQNMPPDIQQELREKLLPTFYLVMGNLTDYIEEFLIVTFIISIVLNLLKMMIRIRIVFHKHGWSKHVLTAFFEGMYIAFMPWRAAKFHREELEMLVDQKANQLGNAYRDETIKMEKLERRIDDLEGHQVHGSRKLSELTVEVSAVRETMHRPPIFDRLRDIAPVNLAPPPKYDHQSKDESPNEDDYTPLLK